MHRRLAIRIGLEFPIGDNRFRASRCLPEIAGPMAARARDRRRRAPLAADAARGADSAAVAPTPAAASPGSPSYRVTVDAPSPLKETLLRDVGLVRWQGYAEMTDDLLERLAREAIDEARGMAAAEGYFSARIDVKIDRAADPVAVTLIVDLGAPTRIASVRIVVTGPAATTRRSERRRSRGSPANGRLPEGNVFRQAAWSIAKERALATLAGSPYAAARMTRSEAAIDPERASADLVVEFASGPAFHFGAVRDLGAPEIRCFAGQELQHDHARRAVQRRRAEPVRATTQRIGLFRERAGEDRYGGDESRRRRRSTSR